MQEVVQTPSMVGSMPRDSVWQTSPSAVPLAAEQSELYVQGATQTPAASEELAM
jgi:hypothetical protein